MKVKPVFGQRNVHYQPIHLHPQNPHYFWFRGKPTILITSAEHYGAVINAAFDYERYIDTLADAGMNYTRVFSGAYIEVPGSFGIQYNTLAPESEHLRVPWKRSDIPGFHAGGNKFDLDHWDEDYFERLVNFMQKASDRGIVVEVTFFSSWFGNWIYSPLHSENNINNLAPVEHFQVHTLASGDLLMYQEHLVRKIVDTLHSFDNVIYEIQNEPYVDLPQPVQTFSPFGKTHTPQEVVANSQSIAWQHHLAHLVKETEVNANYQHLLAINYANTYHQLREVADTISIINFHYALPDSVYDNYGWNRVIGFDETGFTGKEPLFYRMQAWIFILSGGAIFNNLDYSFFLGKEDGTGKNQAPGGGGKALRTQLRILQTFMQEMDFIHMRPMSDIILHAPGVRIHLLGDAGTCYAGYVYRQNACTLKLTIPSGTYELTWLHPVSGQYTEPIVMSSTENELQLDSPGYENDIAFRLVKKPNA